VNTDTPLNRTVDHPPGIVARHAKRNGSLPDTSTPTKTNTSIHRLAGAIGKTNVGII
jgi:hypothetical protein